MLKQIGIDDIKQFASSRNLQQVVPLLAVVILTPLFALILTVLYHLLTSLYAITLLMADSLGLPTLWSWVFGYSHEPHKPTRKTSGTKRHKRSVRTRTEQLASDDTSEPEHYPGLINVSGTYCFLNSTLQALASLSYLQPNLDELHTKAESLDVPSPVIDALRETLRALNEPKTWQTSLRPVDMISALSVSAKGVPNPLFSSREHQDAQELFQLVSERIKDEAQAIEKESIKDRGLGGITKSSDANREVSLRTVFDGLTANRRSCVECGYTEALWHFSFDNWQLSVPRMGACRLEDCLDDYTRLEVLTDCICRKCSLVATQKRLATQCAAESSSQSKSSSKTKRMRDARRWKDQVDAALKEGRIEENISGLQIERVFSRASTKQAMIARPPPVLALHLNRSLHYGYYAARNSCRVVFPEILDLTSYTTSGRLSTAPSSPISSPPPARPRSTTPTPANCNYARTIYRLSAVVCHYGAHSYGHYVSFRRKPRDPSSSKRWALPRLSCPLECDCELCQRTGPIREDGEQYVKRSRGGWLRLSDDCVEEVGIYQVLQEQSGAFMLFYERVEIPPPSILQNGCRRKESQDTLRPSVQQSISDVTVTGRIIRRADATGARSSRNSEESSRPQSEVSLNDSQEDLPASDSSASSEPDMLDDFVSSASVSIHDRKRSSSPKRLHLEDKVPPARRESNGSPVLISPKPIRPISPDMRSMVDLRA